MSAIGKSCRVTGAEKVISATAIATGMTAIETGVTAMEAGGAVIEVGTAIEMRVAVIKRIETEITIEAGTLKTSMRTRRLQKIHRPHRSLRN